MGSIKLKLPDWAVESLCCPACNWKLIFRDRMQCMNKKCGETFPLVDNIPILIDSKNSLFSVDDFITTRGTYSKRSQSKFTDVLKLMPKIGVNVKAAENYNKIARLLYKDSKNPRVLVLGGGILGKGIKALLDSSIDLIETDVIFGPRTMAIVDAHRIPFEDSSFDAVVIQAVLEHVADPHVCVKEIHRVLKSDGIVYAEIAFMQQVHGGKYDYTRFTYVGLRRLFSNFIEIESGAVCGTGMALAWAYEYFLMSLTNSTTIGKIARIFARFTGFWLKYFDYLTINNPATLDAASGYYFMGKKSNRFFEDKVSKSDKTLKGLK